MPRRIRRPKDKEEIFTKLVRSDYELNFLQLSHVFVLAACLGYYYDKSEEFKKSSEQIAWELFDKSEQDIMKAIALISKGDPSIILEENSDEMLTIIENYASGGLEVLNEKILKEEAHGAERLDALINLLVSPYEEAEEETPEDILKRFME
jgi:dnd system-associated protein 4